MLAGGDPATSSDGNFDLMWVGEVEGGAEAVQDIFSALLVR